MQACKVFTWKEIYFIDASFEVLNLRSSCESGISLPAEASVQAGLPGGQTGSTYNY